MIIFAFLIHLHGINIFYSNLVQKFQKSALKRPIIEYFRNNLEPTFWPESGLESVVLSGQRAVFARKIFSLFFEQICNISAANFRTKMSESVGAAPAVPATPSVEGSNPVDRRTAAKMCTHNDLILLKAGMHYLSDHMND